MTSSTLILLPGLMCDADVWMPLYPQLPTRHTPWVPDYGLNNSLTAMAQLVLQQAPADRFALAGHSMGGRVALEVVRLAPQRVTRLALLDTGHLPRPGGEAGAQEASKRHALLHIAQTQGVRAMAQTWVQGMVHPDRLMDVVLIEAIVGMFAHKSADVFACQIEALLARPDASDVLRTLTLPTLLLCGAQDSWSPPAQHEAMRALAPHAVLDVVADAGHMTPMEQPEAVAQSLSRWLRDGSDLGSSI
ncbi:2-succinyl-6-hydroxy-2,4-cyclohexadiene-1-carboxylate synthase [Rhodoferax lithotrophicus]|uniref:2-succinyl-6-hydroxy-2,4-cyclohexadiene-1-carboxylate synthase n=1 Tax=Rhodoferax lithotrophicus TaxID=2798804 RepID=A0ABM7MMZ5_9BURK|nr:alpha/beta hydrolase [Rhodoferax sp. MIZ03]BCO27616.1 2-succinyl-6-hydroxy-2,4-cyclohexadiene-1-carboxylate synthase [Rhodoferax sp. MIZ03]